MTPKKETIENKIVDIILADSDFASIAVATIGFLFRVPEDYYPLCQVVITGSNEAAQQQTGLNIEEFTGFIRFDLRQQDTPTVNSRKVVVTSYQSVTDLVDATVRLFRENANRKLQNLNESGVWAVRRFTLQGTTEYGVDQRIRENDYENFGVIPFVVETQEARS